MDFYTAHADKENLPVKHLIKARNKIRVKMNSHSDSK